MVGAAFAAVPLYRWFCQATGFGGTTQVRRSAPASDVAIAGSRSASTPMCAAVCRGGFEPEQTAIDVQARRGGHRLLHASPICSARDDHRPGGLQRHAGPRSGAYFSKINCFCFTEQRLAPGETREMAVVFFVDPGWPRTATGRPRTITLSYTFYPVREPRAASRSRPRPAGCRNWTPCEAARAGRLQHRAPAETGATDRRRGRTMAERTPTHHDYHLVNPSPWPLIGSSPPSCMAVGRDHLDAGACSAAAPFVFGLGVARRALHHARLVERRGEGGERGGDHTRVVPICLRYGMILFIASEVMFFVAWFWTFFEIALFPHDVHDLAHRAASAAPGRPRASRPSIPGTCRWSTR